MKESGFIVNDIPRIYYQYLSLDDNFISFKDIGLRIPLQLNGIFPYLSSRK